MEKREAEPVVVSSVVSIADTAGFFSELPSWFMNQVPLSATLLEYANR